MEEIYKYSPTKLGEKLLNDWDNFQYEYIEESDDDCGIGHKFAWQWAGLKGFACITINNNGTINGMSTLGTTEESPVQLYKTLFVSDDLTLLDVFKEMVADKHRWK